MLANKVAVITGGGSGIGRAIARLFSKHRALSVVLDRNAEAAEAAAAEIRKGDGQALAVGADVSQSDQVARAFDEIRRHSARLDILVNNAGMYIFEDALSLQEGDWRRCLDVDLKGAWLCARQGLPRMIEGGGGSIINIASTHAVRAQGHAFPYGVAKAGLLALTRSLAVDFGRQGVRANAICPGLVLSPMGEGYLRTNPKLSLDRFLALQSLPREIYPEDIANAALFLASDLARCITGETLFVDCGRTIFSGIRHAE